MLYPYFLSNQFFFQGTLRPQKPEGLLGTGKQRLGKREIIYFSIRCHHQNDSCVKMDSDESPFNVSLIVRDKVTRLCPPTKIFEEKGKPKRIRTEVPLLTSLTHYCGQAKPVSCEWATRDTRTDRLWLELTGRCCGWAASCTAATSVVSQGQQIKRFKLTFIFGQKNVRSGYNYSQSVFCFLIAS